MTKVSFVGCGSAFNDELGNNVARIHTKDDSHLLLIDCGESTFTTLKQLNYFNNIKKVSIVITHTHADHIGSLGTLLAYTYYILKIKTTVYFPQPHEIYNHLDMVGVNRDIYEVVGHGSNITLDIEKEDGVPVITFKPNLTPHVEELEFSYGYYVTVYDDMFYYSGDTNQFSLNVLAKLEKGEISKVFQDTSLIHYEGNVHLSLKNLEAIVPQHLREKVYCMHIDQFGLIEEAEALGFKTVNEL